MSAAAVQTPAQADAEPDLFGDAPAATAPTAPARGYAHIDCELAFTGRVRGKPHIASKPSDQVGHFRPVLVVELDHVGPANQVLTAHIPFTDETREQGEALARSLRQGDVVTVSSHVSDMRVFLASATLSTTKAQ